MGKKKEKKKDETSQIFLEMRNFECVGPSDCAATLTTVSRGSGLHLLLGLLVTEVTVAMGSWKWMRAIFSCVPFCLLSPFTLPLFGRRLATRSTPTAAGGGALARVRACVCACSKRDTGMRPQQKHAFPRTLRKTPECLHLNVESGIKTQCFPLLCWHQILISAHFGPVLPSHCNSTRR